MKQIVQTFGRLMWVCLLVVGSASIVLAQTVISGTLTDGDNGEPLIGANVLVVGTDVGTATDFDGKFELSVPADATAIRISYAGYSTQVVNLVAGQARYDLSMDAGELLDEVVVVGYGTQTQSEVTSAITSIDSKDFNPGTINNAAQLIQGKVAGLSISQPGGDPNGQPTIRLRGLSSFGANTQPLVIIDGVIGAGINSVDPMDIASVNVLKDGAAAAIYGTRASAGVILITTKMGSAGKTTVDYNVQAQFEAIAKRPEIANASRFLELGGLDFTPNENVDTDWIDEVTRVGQSQVHNLALGGGVGNGTYRVSLNYRGINGINKGSGFDQLNARLSLTQKALNDKLTFRTDLSTTRRQADFGFNEALRYAIQYNPTAPVFDDSDDRFGGFYQAENFDYFNPVAIQQQGINIGDSRNVFLSGQLSYEIIEGVTGSVQYSYTGDNNTFGQFYNREAYFRGGAAGSLKGFAQRNMEENTNQIIEATLNYNTDFGDIGFDLLGGYSWQQVDRMSFGVAGSGLPNNAFGFNRLDLLSQVATGEINIFNDRSRFNVAGFFGRTQFDFQNTYFLTASLRYEGASQFGGASADKFAAFPAVSAGVDVAKAAGLDQFDRLKLRAGYGVTGALPASPYQSIGTFGSSSFFPIGGNQVQGFIPNSINNPDLRFERKGEISVGLDFALMDYRLTGSVDFYNRSTRDLLFRTQLFPGAFPVADGEVNLNNVALNNTGVELALTYFVGDEKMSYEPTITFATFRTTLDQVDGEVADFAFGEGGVFIDPQSSPGAPGLNDNPTVQVVIGEEIGQLWGPVVDEAAMNAEANPTSWIYVDQNNDGVINVEDNVTLGNGLPDFNFGFNNAFRFGQIDASFLIRGDIGHDLANFTRMFQEPGGSRAISNKFDTEFQNADWGVPPAFNSYYVEDASFVALDNVSVGYRFDVSSNKNINSFRVFAAGQNLFYITNYTGVDPNVRYADPGSSDNGGRPSREFNPSALAPGLDRRNTYFRTASFTIGLSVGF